MDTIVDELVAAYKSMNGYDLASTLSPDPFEKRPKARENYHKEMNSRNINDLVRNVISNESALRNLMSKEERNGWIEVYASYFKALREIIAAEEDRGGNVGGRRI